MPPSPSLRWSPSRETQMAAHKRGHSLESGLVTGIVTREKDDDLALFNEVQNREQDNFLLQDDLDDSLSTNLRYFSDFKLGITIPARGETSDLLNANADKNDYDWLLTPPETPLFSSLDDEVPSVNLPHRGRPRSQPISIPRPTTAEKGNRASRSSASPHRLSPSPRSSSNTLQSRGRPVSVPPSTPILRSSTPSRSPSRSTTPTKPSTPAQRSTTPTPRRMSTGSSVTVASSGRTGTSPVKTNRGNSASPKLRAWQSNIPGFSTDVPPNLRTSLEDRPASYVRGSSPASRNGRGSSPSSNSGRGLSPVSSNARGLSPASRNGRESSSKRQSMSPTASRSASSSCSHDRDQFSSRSKGSIASSGDDDIDSLQSFSVSVSDNLAMKKVGGFPSSRGQVKKPSKVLSSSAPKRSFDSALRQMDRRSPQNMFRPLLSSVPSTTFYAGKANSSNRPVISRNSSITTSSTASSEQGVSFIRDNESSDHDQDHRDRGKEPCPDIQDEEFIFDKVDEIDDAVGHGLNENSVAAHEYSTASKNEAKSGESGNYGQDSIRADVPSEFTSVLGEQLETNCLVNMVTCSKCGRKFTVVGLMDECDDICPHCIEKEGFLPTSSSEAPVVDRSSIINTEVTENSESFDELGSEKSTPKLPELTVLNEPVLAQDETTDGKVQSLPDNFVGKTIVEENHKVDQKVPEQVTEGSNQLTPDFIDQQSLHSDGHQIFNVDVSQGVGISVLLKSSSSKWPIVQGRAFTASEDFSYTRESLNSMRSSVGQGSISTSSSVDLTSSRQADARFQRQLSCRKADKENSRHGNATNVKPLSRGSSFSGTSNHTHHALVFDMSTSEENFDVLTGKMEYEALEETLAVTEEKGGHAELDSSGATAVDEKNKLGCTESCEILDAPAQEPLSHNSSSRLMDSSVAMCPDDDCCISSANAEEFTNNASTVEIEVSTLNQDQHPVDEEAMLDDVACRDDIGEDPCHDSSVIISEEVGMDNECTPGSQNEKEFSPTPVSMVDELQELSVPTCSEDIPVSAVDSCITDPAHDILEESTVMIRDPGGHNSRSLTLEEATDTILFCSSIIHDLAYQAAAIGMEKENLLSLEGSRPTLAILGKSSPNRKDRGRTVNKRTPRSSKSKQKRVETTDVRPASPKTETDIKIYRPVPRDSEAPNRVDSVRPLNPESKCNCTVM